MSLPADGVTLWEGWRVSRPYSLILSLGQSGGPTSCPVLCGEKFLAGLASDKEWCKDWREFASVHPVTFLAPNVPNLQIVRHNSIYCCGINACGLNNMLGVRCLSSFIKSLPVWMLLIDTCCMLVTCWMLLILQTVSPTFQLGYRSVHEAALLHSQSSKHIIMNLSKNRYFIITRFSVIRTGYLHFLSTVANIVC